MSNLSFYDSRLKLLELTRVKARWSVSESEPSDSNIPELGNMP